MQDLDLFGVRESRLHAAQMLKRANHQAGADQQHQRERHLHHDQRVARAMALPACAERAADAAQRGRDTGARVFQDRDDAEERAREQRHTEGERQHQRIDSDFVQPRQRVRTFRDQDPQGGIRQARDPARRPALPASCFRRASPARFVPSRRPARRGSRVPAGGPRRARGTDWPRSHRRSAAPAPACPSPPRAPCRCLRRCPVSTAGALGPGEHSEIPRAPFPGSEARHSARCPTCGPDRHWPAPW